MKNKKLIIFTILLAVISVFVIFFTQKETAEKTLNISDFGKKEAFSLSTEYLDKQGFDVDGYEFAYNVYLDSARDAFLNKNFEKDEIIGILKDDSTPEIVYSARFFKNLEKEEYGVSLDPASKKVIGFSRTVKEVKKEKEISKDEAREISLNFLVGMGYDSEKLEDYDYAEKKFPNRIEQLFTFKILNTERSTEYGAFFKKVSISSSGGNIYSLKEEYFIPEQFKRETASEKSYGLLFTILSSLFSLFMVIAAFVIFFKKARKENIRWKLFLGISTTLFIFFAIDFFNNLNLFKVSYFTNISLNVSLLTAAIFTVITSLVLVGVIYVVGSAGDYYHKKENGKENNFFGNIKRSITERETSISILVGYMLALILTGITSAIYYIGETYFGVWSYGDVGMMSLFTTSVPAISIFITIALFPAILEEFLYRFFGVRFFENVTKSLLWGVVISSLIWAVSHMSYDVFPFYFRGIELLVVGGFLGFYFSRFGVITTITAHYVYNASLALFASYFMADALNFWLIFFVVVIPAILALFGFFPKREMLYERN